MRKSGGRAVRWAGLGLATVAGVGAAQAESGSFFKNLIGGGGGGPAIVAPRAYDPTEAYCPPVGVADGAATVQSFAGAAGDGARLRHQIVFGRLSRECAVRADGAVTVKVGAELRAMLGPAGSSGAFSAPVTVAVKYQGRVLDARGRRVAVGVPAGTAQGTATVIEEGLIVPADKSLGYEIEIGLAALATGQRAPARTAKRRQPGADQATAGGDAQAAGQ